MSEIMTYLYIYSYNICNEIKTRRKHFKECCKCTIFVLAYISLWGNRQKCASHFKYDPDSLTLFYSSDSCV